MRLLRPNFLIAVSLLIVTGCATTGSGGVRVDPDVITRAEISDGQFNTAHEAVQRLRPRWLRTTRQANSFSDGRATGDALGDVNAGSPRARVVLDGVPFGTIADLGRINARDVETMRWYDGTSAVQRWGTGYDAGAILITTQRG